MNDVRLREEAGPADDAWWEQFHLPETGDLFLVRDAAELRLTLDFLVRELALPHGGHVYDQCCGIGSLSRALASYGLRVTGADLCDHFIARAVREARSAGADCTFHCADAFDFVPEAPCDAVVNWYSSFGYADSDERNRRMLQRAFEALKPGGRFALDVPNFPGLIRGFQRCLVRRGESAGRPVTVVRESTVDLHGGRLVQLWTWLVEGRRPAERRSALRLYLPHQIRDMLEQCGFEDVRMFGSAAGGPLTLDASRLICIAERPT